MYRLLCIYMYVCMYVYIYIYAYIYIYIFIYIIFAKKKLEELTAKNNIFSKYLQEKTSICDN